MVTLNELSVRVKQMRETAKLLIPPENDMPGVRVQITRMKVMVMMMAFIIVIMIVIMIGYSDCAVNGWLLVMVAVSLAMMALSTMVILTIKVVMVDSH